MTKIFLILLFVLMCPVSSFAAEEPVASPENTDGVYIVQKYYDSGKLLSETEYKGEVPQGTAKTYYESGQLKIETPIEGGLPEGVEKVYYTNGKIWMERPYTQGKINGMVKTYYENGQLKSERNYKRGEPDDANVHQKEYYPNGNLKMEATSQYVKDSLHGVAKTYHENGKLKSETVIKDSALISQEAYDQRGNLITEE